MKIITRSICVASILLTILSLQGCIVAAVGAGIGAVKYGNAKKMEAQMKCNEAYNTYLSLMIKSHKNPMSIKEYCSSSAPD